MWRFTHECTVQMSNLYSLRVALTLEAVSHLLERRIGGTVDSDVAALSVAVQEHDASCLECSFDRNSFKKLADVQYQDALERSKRYLRIGNDHAEMPWHPIPAGISPEPSATLSESERTLTELFIPTTPDWNSDQQVA